MNAVPVLYTERCVLNGITQEDFPTLRHIVDDALFRRFLPELYKLVRSPKGLQRFLDAFKEYLIQDAEKRIQNYEWFYEQFEAIKSTSLKHQSNINSLLLILKLVMTNPNNLPNNPFKNS